MKSLGQSALDYASGGWAVFPLVPNNKNPLIPKDPVRAAAMGWSDAGHGCKDGTCDISKVWEWWSKYPNANIGIATGPASGILVVDIDSAEAGHRYRSMGDIGKPMVQDTRDGYHLAYAWTQECNGISISAGKLGKGIDTRGEGGYIVGAPSIHPSGHIYSWRSEYDPSPPPKWLIQKLRPKKIEPRLVDKSLFDRVDGGASRYGNAALKNACERIASAMPGQQEVTLNRGAWSIGRLVGGGEIALSYATDLLIAAATCMGSDGTQRPWSEAEIVKKVTKGLSDGMDKPRHAGSPK